MRARYDKSLVKAVGVLLKFTDPPPVGLSLISKVGYRWENVISDNLPTESDLTRVQFRETGRKNP